MYPDSSGGIIFLLQIFLSRRLHIPKYNRILSANLTFHNDYTLFHHCTPKMDIVVFCKQNQRSPVSVR